MVRAVVRMFVVSLVLINLQISQSAFIDRTKPPRVECIHYDPKTYSSPIVAECQSHEDPTPLDFFCQTVWSNHSDNGVSVKLQGCLPVYSLHDGEAAQHSECRNQSSCINKREPKGEAKDVHFCCCHVDNCNEVFSWVPPHTVCPEPETPQLSQTATYSSYFIALITIIPILLIVLVAACCCVCRHRKNSSFSSLSSLTDPTSPTSPPTPTLTHRPVELLEIKARGRFGAVWKGKLGTEMVAVKIFPLQDKQSWFAEQEIYNLPQMEHQNILNFLGVDRKCEGLQMEFWLVTSFHQHGSLCDFLKSNTVTLEELTRICLTMARGLAHLHAEVGASKAGGLKPAIAHRDFKSKNVLIRSDLTACIGDFGLALQFRPNEVVGDTHGQVGTRRYMAPEVLEGAINFSRDAFLRIDMYACGLVLWEVCTRVTGVNGGPPHPTPSTPHPTYKMPFEAEASPHPSLEEICELVVGRKVRPAIPQWWKDQPALAVLCDTIEECWDHDAEARLSASCVVERLQQIKLFREEEEDRVVHQITSFEESDESQEQVNLLPMGSSSGFGSCSSSS